MIRTTLVAAVLIAVVITVSALVVRNRPVTQNAGSVAPTPHAPSFIYGRVTTGAGTTHEGRLRWGGDQEAFWGDYFNGTKDDNPWAAYAPSEEPVRPRRRIEIFGFKIGGSDVPRKLRRLFMARFGDIARIEAHIADVRVALKSGTVVTLDRFAAGDIDDGVRVWDTRGNVVDLDARRIATIQFLGSAPVSGTAAARLHGTVRARQGSFTGFILWDQQDGLATDTLDGRTADGERSVRYETIRTVARQSRESARVTLLDGRTIVLSGAREVGVRHRGIYVDDPRYGRVLISWDAFEHVDFSPGGSGPAYADFPPGRPLTGTVTTRDGRRLAGRLIYDFDESETTETLDAALQGIDYNIPFSLVASIVPHDREGSGTPRATVTLRGGESLRLERTGDVGEGNAGLLVFVDGHERPEYVSWADVVQIDLAARSHP